MGGIPNLRQHQRPMMLFTFTLAAKAAYHHFHRKCKAGSIGITQKKKNLTNSWRCSPNDSSDLISKEMFWQVCPGFPGRPVPDTGTSALSWALLTCQRAAQCALLGSAPLLTAVLSLSGCFGLKLLTHLLSHFFINTLGFTAPCWIKCKVCKCQLLAYSLLQQHWEGFSSPQPAAAIVIVFGLITPNPTLAPSSHKVTR